MKKFKILYVSSEVVPYAKTGGLADVAGSLPKALWKSGNDVRIIMPRYKFIKEREFRLREVLRLKNFLVPMEKESIPGSIKTSFLPGTKVQVYLLENNDLLGREGLYVDPKTKADYPDNAERFIFFSRAVLATLKLLSWQPNIIHINDWQSALIPLYLKTIYANDEFFKKIKCLLTIHNMGYQGNFPSEIFAKTGLPPNLFYPGSDVEFYNQFSFLKSGITQSDAINTVSQKYAEEIQSSPEFGGGMEGLLKNRSKVLFGILNGIDTTVWNPATDSYLPACYTSEKLEGKVTNKKALLEKNKLNFREDIPVIGMISRLADQKGFDLIAEGIQEIMSLDIQLVILGTGEEKYHRMLKEIAKKFPEKIGLNLTFDDPIAHLIEAGSDMFLMPSRYEPCGLNQMYSLKYGTVPIVRATGGLADTIRDYHEEDGSGTGFTFDKYDSRQLLNTIRRAIKVFHDKKAWKKLMKTGMKEDYSWEASAKKYIRLYEQIGNQ